MTFLEIRNITKAFNKTVALNNVSFEVKEHEFFTLLGPSGCGKTTLLRIIGGLLKPIEGHVILDGEDITDWPPYSRGMSMVFQSYALFPHMNVFENIAFGLRLRKVSENIIKQEVKKALEILNLEGYENRMPKELSGGEQQRVALARALVIKPRVLLLDEPLSNLDLKLRQRMRKELKDIQKYVGVTTIYVTHDQTEALSMSDRIAVMNKGRIMQIGNPEEIYEYPKNKFVADFIGETNFLEGIIKRLMPEVIYIEINNRFIIPLPSSIQNLSSLYEGKKVIVSIRPEHIKITNEKSHELNGRIASISYLGNILKYYVKLPNGDTIQVNEVRGASELSHSVGEIVYLKIIPPVNLIDEAS
jgi:spermidine/putrescine transport system ATP-binding protein